MISLVVSLLPFAFANNGSLSLQEALEKDLGQVCVISTKKSNEIYVLQPDEESNCREAGGTIQSASRKQLVELQNSPGFVTKQGYHQLRSNDTKMPNHRLSDPLNSQMATGQ